MLVPAPAPRITVAKKKFAPIEQFALSDPTLFGQLVLGCIPPDEWPPIAFTSTVFGSITLNAPVLPCVRASGRCALPRNATFANAHWLFPRIVSCDDKECPYAPGYVFASFVYLPLTLVRLDMSMQGDLTSVRWDCLSVLERLDLQGDSCHKSCLVLPRTLNSLSVRLRKSNDCPDPSVPTVIFGSGIKNVCYVNLTMNSSMIPVYVTNMVLQYVAWDENERVVFLPATLERFYIDLVHPRPYLYAKLSDIVDFRCPLGLRSGQWKLNHRPSEGGVAFDVVLPDSMEQLVVYGFDLDRRVNCPSSLKHLAIEKSFINGFVVGPGVKIVDMDNVLGCSFDVFKYATSVEKLLLKGCNPFDIANGRISPIILPVNMVSFGYIHSTIPVSFHPNGHMCKYIDYEEVSFIFGRPFVPFNLLEIIPHTVESLRTQSWKGDVAVPSKLRQLDIHDADEWVEIPSSLTHLRAPGVRLSSLVFPPGFKPSLKVLGAILYDEQDVFTMLLSGLEVLVLYRCVNNTLSLLSKCDLSNLKVIGINDIDRPKLPKLSPHTKIISLSQFEDFWRQSCDGRVSVPYITPTSTEWGYDPYGLFSN